MWRRLVSVCVVLLLVLVDGGCAFAVASLTQAYTVAAGDTITAGELVSTRSSAAGQVALADTANGQGIAGVVVAGQQSVLAVTDPTQTNSVNVASGGVNEVYVSTINGDIHRGDLISVSPISGFGMKAAAGFFTIGTAQADFTSATGGAGTYQVPKASGSAQTVSTGSIPVAIAIGSGIASSAPSGLVGNIQTIIGAVAGHQVSALKAVLGFLVAVTAIGALIALVYGAIHASIVAMGRNPLARRSILRTLAQVSALACLIVVVAGVILYLTLR